MSATRLACLALVLVPALAFAEEPPTPIQRILEAFEAKDAERMARIAAEPHDAWILADTIFQKGKTEAALAYAEAVKRPGAEGLVAYLTARQEVGPDPKLAKALADATAAIRRREPQAVLPIADALGDELDTVSRILVELHRGHAHLYVDGPAASAKIQARAAKAAEALGWIGGAARAQSDEARSAIMGGDLRGATKLLRNALKIAERIQEPAAQARYLTNLGYVYFQRAMYDRAVTYWRKSVQLKRGQGDRGGAARTQLNLGAVFLELGRYADALHVLEEAAEVVKTDVPRNYPGALLSLSNAWSAVGDQETALRYLEKAVELARKTNNLQSLSVGLGNMASAEILRGQSADLDRASTLLEETLALREKIHDRRGVGNALTMLGHVEQQKKNFEEAIEHYERALGVSKEVMDRAEVVRILEALGLAHKRTGRTAKGIEYLEQALREAQRMRLARAASEIQTELAVCYLEGKRYADALRAAEAGLAQIEHQLGGLDDTSSARMRGEHMSLFAVGTAAAFQLGDVAKTLLFLESGRAGSLMERLRGSDALRLEGVVPSEHLKSKAEAEAAERAARAAYEQAVVARKPLAEVRTLGEQLDAARERVQAALGRIQRLRKRKAQLVYPRAATPEEIQDLLEPGQALVVYGAGDPVIACVITADSARLVRCSAYTAVREAYEALRLDDPKQQATPALARLRAALVNPLALGDAVTQVIVAPEDFLAYVPFGVLFDLPVALTPSGSTHVHLVEEAWTEGKGVLAVGDPDYAAMHESSKRVFLRGRTLLPLPATRAEAKAVGDVVLLGAAATVPGFVEKLATRERWRAVHFACHGLIDAQRPLFSSLALTEQEDVDPFLDGRDLATMELAADLAVLSACETSRGSLMRAEGIMGIARSFMYAGTPRVLCSLWKVDDEATQALMIKFYELWNPKDGEGIAPAAALRKAQAHVRSQKKWAHPYYWAAWVLWGLPG